MVRGQVVRGQVVRKIPLLRMLGMGGSGESQNGFCLFVCLFVFAELLERKECVYNGCLYKC